MNIQYEILNFDPVNGSVLVRYFNDDSELVYNVDVPIENGSYVSELELRQLIVQMQPTFQLSRTSAIKNLETPEYLKAYIRNPVVLPETYTQEQLEIMYGRELTLSELAAWEEYNQAVLEIPNQAEYPDNIIYPIQPEIVPR